MTTTNSKASKTETRLNGALVVTGTIEGNEVHLVRTYAGQTQHKFLRADIHQDLWICVNADADYLRDAILKQL